MQCVRRPFIPCERAWHVLEQQRDQCGWSWEQRVWEEMMVEVKMGPVHVGPCRWLMGCHWIVLAEEWESLNTQMANGHTMYKSRTLAPNCRNLPRKQASHIITSQGSCLLEVRQLSLVTESYLYPRKLNSDFCNNHSQLVRIWFRTNSFPNFCPRFQLRTSQKKPNMLPNQSQCLPCFWWAQRQLLQVTSLLFSTVKLSHISASLEYLPT